MPAGHRVLPQRNWKTVLVVAGVAVVIGLVVVLVTRGGGSDGAGKATDRSPARVDRAISFSEAKAKGLVVTYPKLCDKRSGHIELPVLGAPECFANPTVDTKASSPGACE